MPNYTRKAIRDSFIRLLNEKPLNQITIRNIVDDCGVNRNTFYYYYQDLPQLIESIVNEDADRIIQEYPTLNSMEECLDAAVSFSLKNKIAVLHIFKSVNRNIYEQYLWRVCDHVCNTYLNTILADREISESDHQVIICYLKCLSFGSIMDWLERGMKDNVQILIHRICELKKGHLEEMIDRCDPAKKPPNA